MRVARVRAVTLAVLLASAGAHASPSDTVVVASADPGFVRAVAAVLGAAGIRSVSIAEDDPLASADPSSVPRQLADREHAAAAVVLARGTDGATLIAYDRGVDRALVRVLHDRVPLGPRARAEAAHMVRTMLRAVRIPPELELPPEPDEVIAMGSVTPPDERVAGAVGPDAGVAAPDAGAVGADAGMLAIALAGGVRVGAPGSASRAGGDVQLIWRPDAPGVAVTVSLAGSATVEAAAFAGTVSDAVGAVTARLPVELAPGWRLTGELGGAVHRIRLAGVAPAPMGPKPPMPPMDPKPPKPPMGPMPAMAPMGPVDIVRYDPALRFGASVVYAASPGISVGLGAWLDALVVRHDLRVASQPVLDVPATQVTVSLTVVARIL